MATTSKFYQENTSASRGNKTGSNMFSPPPPKAQEAQQKYQQEVRQMTQAQAPIARQKAGSTGLSIKGPKVVPKF